MAACGGGDTSTVNPSAEVSVVQGALQLNSPTQKHWGSFASFSGISVNLGMSDDEVLTALGKPIYIGDSGSWSYENGATIGFDNVGASAIAISDNENWILCNGLSIGSTKQDVATALEIPDYTQIGQSASLYLNESMEKVVYNSTDKAAYLSFSFREGVVSNIHLSSLPQPIFYSDNIINIFDISTSEPNSANSVDVSVSFENTSDKVIKYIYFTVVPYNAVDDSVCSDIGGKSAATLKITGPISQDDLTVSYTSKNTWYNSTVTRAQIESVKIEYMDETSVSLTTAK